MILSCGLPRAGSTSVAQALTILGYNTLHFCPFTNSTPEHYLGFNFDDYDAVVDWTQAGQIELFFTFVKKVDQVIFLDRKKGFEVSLANFGINSPDRYIKYLEHAKDYIYKYTEIPYVVLDIPGNPRWKELCQFLGKPIPDINFPHLNESEFNYKV